MSADTPSISREEAARLLGASERHVRRLIQQGRLPLARDARGSLVLQRQAVLALAAEQRGVITQLEAATRLGCGRRTIRRMLDDGRLQPVPTPGGHDRVALASVAARLEDTTRHADKTGHKADTTGQSIHAEDNTGHDLPEPLPRDAELVSLLDTTSHDLNPPPTGGRPPVRRRRQHSHAAAAILILVALSGALLIAQHLRSTGPSRSAGALPGTHHHPAPPGPLRPHQAPTGRTGGPTATGPRAVTSQPRARGGQATSVTHPVRRIEVRLSATRHARTPATRPDETPSRSTAPQTTPPPASTPRSTSACSAVYGPEGLC